MPALYVSGLIICGDVTYLSRCRIERSWAGEVIRESQSGRPEASARCARHRGANILRIIRSRQTVRALPFHTRVHDKRPFVRQQILTAEPIEVYVSHSVSASDHGLRSDVIG